MVEKITALVFSALLLILSIIGTVNEPSIDNIVAIVFSAIAVIAICITIFRDKTVTIISDPPKGNRPVDRSMKLANEIAPYIKVREDGNIEITVKK